MFCPECGKPLENAEIRTCPFCGTTFEIPEQPEPPLPEAERKTCRRSAAALLFGAATFVFGMLTLLCKLLSFDLRILYGTAAATFFCAPLACCFGFLGILARIQSPEKRGLPSAVAGLLLGLAFGLLAAYCLFLRVFRA